MPHIQTARYELPLHYQLVEVPSLPVKYPFQPPIYNSAKCYLTIDFCAPQIQHFEHQYSSHKSRAELRLYWGKFRVLLCLLSGVVYHKR